jgi:hypothetical protein
MRQRKEISAILNLAKLNIVGYAKGSSDNY